jgi:hypothetical protein
LFRFVLSRQVLVRIAKSTASVRFIPFVIDPWFRVRDQFGDQIVPVAFTQFKAVIGLFAIRQLLRADAVRRSGFGQRPNT